MRALPLILGALVWLVPAAVPASKIPLVHTTDLFHPPADPDDHFDLATVYALEEFDVKAVLLDRALLPGSQALEPGYIPVAQLSHMTGRTTVVAAGPSAPLSSPRDVATGGPHSEQTAIHTLLDVLRTSPDRVVVTVLGSARIVAAAYQRDPGLLKNKIRAVLLNAGSSGDDAAEYNVRIDVPAYAGLLRSGLPIDWYPCAAAGPNKSVANNVGERNTFWRAAQRDLFNGLPQPLLSWFLYALRRSPRNDLLRALREDQPMPEQVLGAQRNMWSTASFALAAGRVLAKTSEGWRFLPAGRVTRGQLVEAMELEPVAVTVSDDGRTTWKPATRSNIRLFRRRPGPQYDAAMTEGLNALLGSLPVERP
jgi:hypothetical protein